MLLSAPGFEAKHPRKKKIPGPPRKTKVPPIGGDETKKEEETKSTSSASPPGGKPNGDSASPPESGKPNGEFSDYDDSLSDTDEPKMSEGAKGTSLAKIRQKKSKILQEISEVVEKVHKFTAENTHH